MAHGGGKPKSFESPEQFQRLNDEYFDFCDSQKETFTDSKGQIKTLQKPYTMSGLCVFLGITRETWSQYAKNPDYANIAASSKSKIENYCEENTMLGKLNPIFSIFSLKNNFGWVDKMEINNTKSNEQLTQDDVNTTLQALKKKKDDKYDVGDK